MNSSALYNIRLVYKMNDLSAGFIAVVANVTLLFLIVTRTSKEMYPYRKIMLQICLIDMVYVVFMLLGGPIMAYRHGHEIIYANGLIPHIFTNLNFTLITLWLFSGCLSIFSIPVPFVYRYFVLVRDSQLSGLSYMLLLVVPVTLNTIHVTLSCVLYYPTSEGMTVAREEFSGFFGDDYEINVKVIAFDAFLMGTGCFLVVMWCTIKIKGYLKEHLKYASDSTKELNAQLNRMLIAQTIGPLSVTVVPLLTITYCIITKNDSVNSTTLIMLPFAWIPVINPILTIWFVKPYRRAIFQKAKLEPIINLAIVDTTYYNISLAMIPNRGQMIEKY